MSRSPFLFAGCQPGAEQALKAEAAWRAPNLRLAFSRPGFVTFKSSDSIRLNDAASPRFAFARTQGLSLGQSNGDNHVSRLATKCWGLPGVQDLLHEFETVGLHVWRRDETLPGQGGVEPGCDLLSEAVEEGLRAAAPSNALGNVLSGSAVLDVALVTATEWWIGAHLVQTRTDRWSGGVPPLRMPPHVVSRAYLKMEEALRWSGLPTRKGDVWIELGCAPGGASQSLLDRGMIVIGVDPAEVDPALNANADFFHHQKRASDVRRHDFAHANWLAADINAPPNYTLDAVEPIVTHPSVSVRGLVLTLKLPTWNLVEPDALNALMERVQSWGYQDVRFRQLAFNRREACLVALRSRSQRRMTRARKR